MTKVEYGQITVNSAGLRVPVLSDSTLVVQRVVVFIADSSTEVSAGYHDSTIDFNGSSAYQDENTSQTITHYRNISGVKTKRFEGKISYLDTGEFGINVTTLAAPTSLKYVVFGV